MYFVQEPVPDFYCKLLRFPFNLVFLPLQLTDVKELVPEFYCSPEFLLNANRFALGVKQASCACMGCQPGNG